MTENNYDYFASSSKNFTEIQIIFNYLHDVCSKVSSISYN